MESRNITMERTGTVLQWLSGPMSSSAKFAAFDMDDTLMTGKYPYPGAREKLERLTGEGYSVVVFSNQKAVPGRSDKFVESRMLEVSINMKVPIHFFCARGSDEYRKPCTGMISLVPASYGKIEFYVGDAAGREGDFSDSDKEFAKNAGVPFYTPESFFNEYPVIQSSSCPSLFRFETVHFLTMVILVGYPGCGKTTFCRNFLSHLARVSRDVERTKEACLRLADRFLESNQSVVIDNLNGTRWERKAFADLASRRGAGVFIVHFRSSMAFSMKRNKLRDCPVPDVAFYAYRKNFELPDVEEGAEEILSIVY